MPMLRRVLVVDDDPAIRDVLTLVFSVSGYEVRTAADGAVALQILGAWRPDVIILDLVMPVLNGWGFRCAQLADDQLAAIPVVMLSASAAAVRGEDILITKILAKPFHVPELLNVVGQLTESAFVEIARRGDR